MPDLNTVWTSFYENSTLVLLAGFIIVVAINAWRWQQDLLRIGTLKSAIASLPALQATPKVSVLVAAWNEAANIQDHVRAFLDLRYTNIELILCAGGFDSTYEAASKHQNARVKVLKQYDSEGKQAALRRCLEQADGEIIFLTDADCILSDSALELTLAPLVNEGERAATGRFEPQQRQRKHPFVKMQWFVDNHARSHGGSYVNGLIGRNAAVVTGAIQETGGFQSQVFSGTDYYLAQQLCANNTAIRYVHDSAIETQYETAIGSYIRQQSRWIRNIILHGYEFRAIDQVASTLMQCVIGAIVIAWPLIVLVTGKSGLAIWLAFLAYGTLARFRYVRFGELTLNQPFDPRLYILAPFLFLLDQLMLVVALTELALPWRRWKW